MRKGVSWFIRIGKGTGKISRAVGPKDGHRRGSGLAQRLPFGLGSAFSLQSLKVHVLVAHVAERGTDRWMHARDLAVDRLGDPPVGGMPLGRRTELRQVHRLPR